VKFRGLIARNLWFHWRGHLAVLLATATATAVIVGALLLGDCVRGTLRHQALDRLAGAQLAVANPQRFFKADLEYRLTHWLEFQDKTGLGHVRPLPMIQTTGRVSRGDGQAAANQVQVLGVGGIEYGLEYLRRFDAPRVHLEAEGPPLPPAVGVNPALASRLGIRVGDEVVVRVAKPEAMAIDSPMFATDDNTVTFRIPVKWIVPAGQWGDFSLHANQSPPLNLFLPREFLAGKLDVAGRANLLLIGNSGGGDVDLNAAREALESAWTLSDAELEFQPVGEGGNKSLQMTSRRVFLDGDTVRSASNASPSFGVLTWFVNELRVKDRATPYSFVTAVGSAPPPALRGMDALLAAVEGGPVKTLKNDEIIINDWLAQDLLAKPGDVLTISYFAVTPQMQLEQREAKFTVRGMAPIAGLAGDRTLTPEFPGLADAEDCRHWKSEMVDISKIRDKDQAYWKQFRGTPKAFVTLEAGRKMWANPLGSLTAVRFADTDEAKVKAAVRSHLTAASQGLVLEDVRTRMLESAEQGTDFGQLYLGFSGFLLAAALGLVAMVFSLGMKQRAGQVGLLLAVGWRRRRVLAAFLAESAWPAAAGTLAGVVCGELYTRAMLHGLATTWSAAAGGRTFGFYPTTSSIAIGAGAGFAIAMVTIFLTLRRQFRQPPAALMAGEEPAATFVLRPLWRRLASMLMGPATAIAAGVILALAPSARRADAAPPFFASGALLLLAALATMNWRLRRQVRSKAFCGNPHGADKQAGSHVGLPVGAVGRSFKEELGRQAPVDETGPGGSIGSANGKQQRRQGQDGPDTHGQDARATRRGLVAMSLGSISRRPGRSLATVAIIACATFILAAVGANRRDDQSQALSRSSGTGGFALVAESSLPVTRDLNSPKTLTAMGLVGDKNVGVVPLRLHEGDRADCLNLNRARQPRLLGVDPGELDSRNAFQFVEVLPGRRANWACLDGHLKGGDIPAVVDENTTWSLGKKLGDHVEYVDAHGRVVQLRLVGVIVNSVLQGNVMISAENFSACFPSEGYRFFLIDTNRGRQGEVAAAFTRQMSNFGMSVVQARDRMSELDAVENSYLDIFTLLGGLGMALGSVGLAAVVMRNVLERRGELAVLQAVGFAKGRIRGMVMIEHVYLLAMGVVCGLVPAAVATAPAIARGIGREPMVSLGVMLAVVFAGGVLWTALATYAALRGPLLPALRGE
jgi:ABC-type lipoprotein release transport system permease subunit